MLMLFSKVVLIAGENLLNSVHSKIVNKEYPIEEGACAHDWNWTSYAWFFVGAKLGEDVSIADGVCTKKDQGQEDQHRGAGFERDCVPDSPKVNQWA